MNITIKSSSEIDTASIGKSLATALKPGAVVCLKGELGAGKTIFIKGMATGLAIDPDDVTSPTFTMINEYQSPGGVHLFHFDFFRIETKEQFDSLGAEEYFWGEGVCAVEWANLFPDELPHHSVRVKIKSGDNENKREITIRWDDSKYIDDEILKNGLQNTKIVL